ncbi:TetR/AcrR family transcriptional regulator [Paenibacillus sp. UMB4589-SE434]|uniref:TetR/AcrR family transcriptional regulator n=1 Tax=Paenibacillus sp. UMB4589-SE434 TaxID=3046314 RepID=UPI002550B012|nr:TetR/AcrR family transcriptional regulator [Paenibacillus sp. UMB4589-SE434]MDK8181376.1 TetR/AcrR family transcriptional regulator [Paenibacillus sp. UMB4589-SE434]
MIEKFLNLGVDKQERIINAALKVFSQKGYEQASTNEIVKEAGISKGLLFHYFNNKKELFLYLYGHAVEQLMNEFVAKLNQDQKDIFMKLRQALLLKFDMIQRYPDVFDFLKTAYFENCDEIKPELEHYNKQLVASGYSTIFQDVDHSLFKEGTDVTRAIQVIFWTLEGFGLQQQAKWKASRYEDIKIDEVMEEIDRYMQILKQAFYR